MDIKWIFTNINEEKSYIITNDTLMGERKTNNISIFRANVSQNDIRFKIRISHIGMRIYRRDIKYIDVKVNNQTVPRNEYKAPLHHNDFFSIESYVFMVTRIGVDKNMMDEILLKRVTKEAVHKFRTIQKNKEKERPVAVVRPNIPPLTGRYLNGKMI